MQLPHIWLYVTAILLLLISSVLFIKGYEKVALAFLFAGALFIRLFMVYLDPFLNVWDEQFHALVAKNLMVHPFKPILVNEPSLWYDYTNWCGNFIWLHKQPLFLWQMALSMKIFGINEFSVRYPSVLMGAFMVLMIYKLTFMLTKDKVTAFVAALFMCMANFQLILISGAYATDQNDVVFGFYLLASLWCYAEYTEKRKLHWILLIGFFAGCAILNKWLPGLLVFAGWGTNILISLFKKQSFRQVPDLLLALFICVITFLPWQLYIFHAFPKEAAYEFTFNTRHMFEVVEGHAGDYLYYWDCFGKYFGTYTWYIILPALGFLLFKKDTNPVRISLLLCFIFSFLFYSIIVKTKMSNYFYSVVPIGYIFIAVIFVKTIRFIKLPDFICLAAGLVMALILFDFKTVYLIHSPGNAEWQLSKRRADICKQLSDYIPHDTKYILFLPDEYKIAMMFYNKNIIAKTDCSPEDMQIIKNNNQHVAVFATPDKNEIPGYIKDYRFTYIIPLVLP